MGKTVESTAHYNVVLPEPLEKDYKYTCQLCNKQFVKLSRFKVHQNVHLEKKNFKCSFEGCESAYYRLAHLKRHEATRHSKSGGSFMCTFEGCTASFDSSSSLYFHEKRKHCIKKFKCKLCGEMFSKKYIFKEHEATHSGEKPFQCLRKKCGETFSTHSSFKAHQKMHLEKSGDTVTAYKCTDCDEIFEKWSSYLSHRKFHPATATRVPCPVCEKMFSLRALRQHQKVHESDQDKVAFCCPHEGCPRFYFHVRNLTLHARQAHEGHKFECNVCHRKLSTKQKLALHIKAIHENPIEKAPSKKKSTFPRKTILNMLTGEKNFEVKRTGPPKGYKPKKQSANVPEMPDVLANSSSTSGNDRDEMESNETPILNLSSSSSQELMTVEECKSNCL